MKKVSEASPDPRTWHAEVTCAAEGGCKERYTVHTQDLVLMYWFRSDGRQYYTGAQCPYCLTFNSVRVPENIWQPLHTLGRKEKAIFDGIDQTHD